MSIIYVTRTTFSSILHPGVGTCKAARWGTGYEPEGKHMYSTGRRSRVAGSCIFRICTSIQRGRSLAGLGW